MACAQTDIAFAAQDPGLRFHDLASGRASFPDGLTEIEIAPPAYRGKRLLPVLSWLVTNRLGPGAHATWRVERRHGPDYVRRALEPLGWSLEPERAARWLLMHGDVPAPHELPAPRSFSARGLVFEADYGVFSAERIDPGSELLLEVAARGEPVEKIADIGTGYGALAVSLVSAGLAGRALATEVDSISAWLAERNAARAAVDMRLELDPDPLVFAATPLTVCNVPTHLDAGATASLMAGLSERARHGRVLAVVHASLADRFGRYLARAMRHAGAEHVVFEALPA
jgi:16S rRNA G1207 methylase RsmC